jgi:hypothetical protein
MSRLAGHECSKSGTDGQRPRSSPPLPAVCPNVARQKSGPCFYGFHPPHCGSALGIPTSGFPLASVRPGEERWFSRWTGAAAAGAVATGAEGALRLSTSKTSEISSGKSARAMHPPVPRPSNLARFRSHPSNCSAERQMLGEHASWGAQRAHLSRRYHKSQEERRYRT